MIHTNYHTHLLYCNHAIGHTEDYVEAALKNNFTELGISDHGPLLGCFMSGMEYDRFGKNYNFMKLDTLLTKYIPEVNAAKIKYKEKIKILLGFEIEYFSTSDFFIRYLKNKVDYLNLGVHLFEYKDKILNSYSDVDYETIYYYMAAAIKGMETKLFNCIVHPDLFMMRYKDENGNRTFDKHCEYVTRKILESAIENNIYVEMNANGINNSKASPVWLYPCLEFWQIAKEYKDLKIIIGADAHNPEGLTSSVIDEALAFTEGLGLKICDKMEVLH